MAVKILHAADFHMDSPFDSLPTDKAVQRRREQRELLAHIVRIANDEDVQLVLLAGDLFDSAASYHETGEALIHAFSEIHAKIFIAPGNHDFWCEKSPYSYLEFPDNVHIFTSTSVRCVDLPELGCRVWGAGMNSPACQPLLHGFTADSNGINIMVLHGDMTGGEYNPVTEDDIARSRLDYLALGHIHKYSGIKKAGRTFYSYPGCPEGRGFDETGKKGVVVGTVGKGTCSLRFVPLNGREYHILNIDVTGADDLAGHIAAAIPSGLERDICRIVITGEYAGRVDTGKLAENLSDKFFHVTVRNETHLPHDIWASAGDDTLTGLFVSKMLARYEAAKPEDRDSIELAVRYGLAALEKREEWRP